MQEIDVAETTGALDIELAERLCQITFNDAPKEFSFASDEFELTDDEGATGGFKFDDTWHQTEEFLYEGEFFSLPLYCLVDDSLRHLDYAAFYNKIAGPERERMKQYLPANFSDDDVITVLSELQSGVLYRGRNDQHTLADGILTGTMNSGIAPIIEVETALLADGKRFAVRESFLNSRYMAVSLMERMMHYEMPKFEGFGLSSFLPPFSTLLKAQNTHEKITALSRLTESIDKAARLRSIVKAPVDLNTKPLEVPDCEGKTWLGLLITLMHEAQFVTLAQLQQVFDAVSIDLYEGFTAPEIAMVILFGLFSPIPSLAQLVDGTPVDIDALPHLGTGTYTLLKDQLPEDFTQYEEYVASLFVVPSESFIEALSRKPKQFPTGYSEAKTKHAYRCQERERTIRILEPFHFVIAGQRCYSNPLMQKLRGNKARKHNAMLDNRPYYITAACILQNAVCVLPGFTGSKPMTQKVIGWSIFVRPGLNTDSLSKFTTTTVDRCIKKRNPSLMYYARGKVFISLHYHRTFITYYSDYSKREIGLPDLSELKKPTPASKKRTAENRTNKRKTHRRSVSQLETSRFLGVSSRKKRNNKKKVQDIDIDSLFVNSTAMEHKTAPQADIKQIPPQ
ncbi:hypothetical protein PCE1_001444 [Barthelona sp. PCE]